LAVRRALADEGLRIGTQQIARWSAAHDGATSTCKALEDWASVTSAACR